MSWGGLNPALTAWRTAVMARFPDKDTTSDGARADAAHGQRSQHQADADGTVDAYDMDVNVLRSGRPAGSVTEMRIVRAMKLDFEQDPHGRGQLWIHDGFIANADISWWLRRPYTGANPHDKHVHWESRQGRERDGRVWPMPHTDALLRELRGDDMTPEELLAFDGVKPNPYPSGAGGESITVGTALRAAAVAEVQTRNLEMLLREVLDRLDAVETAVRNMTRPNG